MKARTPMRLVSAVIRASLLISALITVPAWAGAPLVIVLSWDGMRWDFPDRAPFPGLTRMQNDGLRAERLVAGWPSTTFPGHVTLATGAWVDAHGIVDNEFLDRARGVFRYSGDASWLDAEPLWITAQRQGIDAATYYWVGSETDWHGQRQRYRVAPFNGETPESSKVDQLLAWLDLPPDERPRLLMAYWHGADAVGHRRGPDSSEIDRQIYAQDAQLVRLLDGIDARQLWNDTTLFVVSDHGMTAMHGFFDLPGFLLEHGFPARVYGGPGVAHVFLNDAAQIDGAFALLSAHKPFEVFRGGDLPERFHLKRAGRVGDLVVISDPTTPLNYPEWWLRALYSISGPIAGIYPGGHGFDPALPDMGATLLAMGRGVPKHVRIGSVPMIDVAPTVTKLLGIDPPANSIGTALPSVVP